MCRTCSFLRGKVWVQGLIGLICEMMRMVLYMYRTGIGEEKRKEGNNGRWENVHVVFV